MRGGAVQAQHNAALRAAQRPVQEHIIVLNLIHTRLERTHHTWAQRKDTTDGSMRLPSLDAFKCTATLSPSFAEQRMPMNGESFGVHGSGTAP